jgi:D-tyrosyl-tRNA(Tyr) deacylase
MNVLSHLPFYALVSFDASQKRPAMRCQNAQGMRRSVTKTLFASTKKGNRPSYSRSARPEIAIPLYERLIIRLAEDLGRPVQTGEFGADMEVAPTNDGPVTIIIDTKTGSEG